MRVEDALHGVSRLFLDTAPIIYYVEGNLAYIARVRPFFEQIDAGGITAASSPVTLAECLVIPMRQGNLVLQSAFEDLIARGANTTFVGITEDSARQAADLRARYNLGLLDAFQVALAMAAGCDALLTNDATLARVTELRVLVLDDLAA